MGEKSHANLDLNPATASTCACLYYRTIPWNEWIPASWCQGQQAEACFKLSAGSGLSPPGMQHCKGAQFSNKASAFRH